MYIARVDNPFGSIPYIACPSDPVFYLAALLDLAHNALYKRHGTACNSSCFYGADIVQSLRQGARANPKVKIVQGLLLEKCAAAGAISSGNSKRGRSKRRAGALKLKYSETRIPTWYPLFDVTRMQEIWNRGNP